jgi:hypothetical protein
LTDLEGLDNMAKEADVITMVMEVIIIIWDLLVIILESEAIKYEWFKMSFDLKENMITLFLDRMIIMEETLMMDTNKIIRMTIIK